MALSRLSELAKSFISSQLDPNEFTTQDPKEPYILTSDKSALTRFYVKNNVMTLFAKNDFLINEGIVPNCIADYRLGHRSHQGHHDWHASKQDFEESHTHLGKGNNYDEIITPEELTCLLNEMRSFDRKTSKCPSEECFVTNKDAALISKEYEKFYQEKIKTKKLFIAEYLFGARIQQKCIIKCKRKGRCTLN